MSSLMRSLPWPPKAFLRSGRNPHGRTRPPPGPHHEAHGDRFHCSVKTLTSYITLTGQEGTVTLGPQRSWCRTSLSLGLCRRPDPHRQPGGRPPAPSTRGPRPERGGHVKHFGPLKGKGRSALLTFESLLVTSVYKVFLFKSKWLQTSLAASGPWVTMAAIRFRQARAILFRDKKESRSVRTAETQSHPPRSSCTLGCVVCYPQTRKRKEGDMQTCSFF